MGFFGGFVTKIASLGWGLVYEQAHIQIYKFKHIDDTDMYARFCFQNATTSGNRNCVAVGIGNDVGHPRVGRTARAIAVIDAKRLAVLS